MEKKRKMGEKIIEAFREKKKRVLIKTGAERKYLCRVSRVYFGLVCLFVFI